MQRFLLFAFALAFTAVAIAQPPAPPISQVFAFFCNNDFTSCPLGFDPTLSPVQLSDGLLYVPTFWGGQGNANFGGTIARSSTGGQALVIHTFASVSGRFLGGEHPVLSLAQGPDGNFYGATENGGLHTFGVVYKLARTGQFQLLYNFCSLPNCPDGPAPLTLANDGNFYGVSGTTFFRITTQGAWTQLGTLPQLTSFGTRIIQATDGNFYGAGGDFAFRMTPSGQFTLLHQFMYPVFPTSPLIQANDGNLYGATGASGDGTGIFRLTLAGDLTFIHAMTENEGFEPVQLLQASDGNLWGLSDYRNGSYFTITLDGTSIQSAAFSCASTGCTPQAMMEGRDGNLYGTAINGGHVPGENALGSIFKIAAGLPH
jgi:uncharacterized repeat protein (TIGR03803 family)